MGKTRTASAGSPQPGIQTQLASQASQRPPANARVGPQAVHRQPVRQHPHGHRGAERDEQPADELAGPARRRECADDRDRHEHERAGSGAIPGPKSTGIGVDRVISWNISPTIEKTVHAIAAVHARTRGDVRHDRPPRVLRPVSRAGRGGDGSRDEISVVSATAAPVPASTGTSSGRG